MHCSAPTPHQCLRAPLGEFISQNADGAIFWGGQYRFSASTATGPVADSRWFMRSSSNGASASFGTMMDYAVTRNTSSFYLAGTNNFLQTAIVSGSVYLLGGALFENLNPNPLTSSYYFNAVIIRTGSFWDNQIDAANQLATLANHQSISVSSNNSLVVISCELMKS